MPFELTVEIPVQLHLELEVNLLVCNVVEREMERERVQMKPPIGIHSTHKLKKVEMGDPLYVVVETQIKMHKYSCFKTNFVLLCDSYRIKVKEIIAASTNGEVINGRGSFFNYVDTTRYVG